MNWEQVKKHKLTVYSTVWCSDCRRFKQRLQEAGVDYDEVDIEEQPEAGQKLKRQTGRSAIPYLEIDGAQWVRGWHDEAPGKWDEKIFFQEFQEAVV